MQSERQEQINPSEGVILEIEDAEMLAFDKICRLCANQSEKVIGIYSEEGISNDLGIKMNLYLPVKVADNDTLPLQCCWNCASTVLAWHELVVASVEADRRLRELQIVSTKQTFDDIKEETMITPQEDKSLLVIEDSKTPNITYSEGDDNELPDTENYTYIEYLECAECNLKFLDEKNFASHQENKHGRKRRRRTDIKYNIFCNICRKGFTRRFDMEKHRKLKHPKEAPVTFVVEQLSEDEIKLDDEIKRENQFWCKMCDASFADKSDFNKHTATQHEVVKFRRKRCEIVADYYCDVCNKGFTRKHDMKKHRLQKHPNVPLLESGTDKEKRSHYLNSVKVSGPDNKTYYKCETCEKVFRQSYNLMRHQTIHTGIRSYFCHICGKSYPSSNSLKRHITEHHYGIKKYSCEICDKRFAASATRDEHLNIHTNNRPFVCDVCGKSFKQKASLHTHKLFHSDNYRFSCNVCGKKFRRANELKVHTWLHTGHKPHKCHLCKSSFRLHQDLKKHLRVHNKLNECVCSECGSTFTQERYLNIHKRTHRANSVFNVLPTTDLELK